MGGHYKRPPGFGPFEFRMKRRTSTENIEHDSMLTLHAGKAAKHVIEEARENVQFENVSSVNTGHVLLAALRRSSSAALDACFDRGPGWKTMPRQARVTV